MRRKRFKHHLDTVIDILKGYQILLNYNYFATRGEGEYKLDLLTGNLFFNGKKIKTYPIFNFIYNWFDKDLKKHHIPKQLIKTAIVIITLASNLSQTRSKLSYFQWFKNLIFPKKLPIFTTEILVQIITDEIEYKKQSQGIIFN